MSPRNTKRTLPKNGTALFYGGYDHVEARQIDILVEGSTIIDTASDISAAGDIKVIDCTDNIVSVSVHVSSIPSSELQMGMGLPVAASRDDLGKELPQYSSLGVDCHRATSSYIPYEARLGLQSARAVYGEV